MRQFILKPMLCCTSSFVQQDVNQSAMLRLFRRGNLLVRPLFGSSLLNGQTGSNFHRSFYQTAAQSTLQSCPGVGFGKRLNILSTTDVAKGILPAVSFRGISENRETRALTVWSDLKEIKSSPLPALLLSVSGLIPFVTAPAVMIMSSGYTPWIVYAQTAYGAVILSFLGGIRWGLTLPEDSPSRPDWRSLGSAVIPSLVGWGALLCPEPVSTLTVMTGLAGLAYFDTMLYGYPPWFKALRFIISIFAVLSLWTSFVCRYLLDVKEKDTLQSEHS